MTISAHRHLLIIGGQRCGTTWLQTVLSTHPEIRSAIVTRPEPKFLLSACNHQQYDKLFPKEGGSFYLDKSTTYLERADAAERAQRCVPNALVVAVVRNPADRAHSNWRFSTMHGLEDLSFVDSLDASAQNRPWSGLSTSPFQSLRRGNYAELLAPWHLRFGDQLLVLQYERMVAGGGGTYLRAALSSRGLPCAIEWPTLPPPANKAPGEPLIEPPAQRFLEDYYRPRFSGLEKFGVDPSLWS